MAEAQGIRKSQISRIPRVLPLAKSVESILAVRADQALNAGDPRAAAAGELEGARRSHGGVQDVVSRHPSYIALRSIDYCVMLNVVVPARWMFNNKRASCFSET